MTKLNYNYSKVFYKGLLVGLLCVFIAVMTCFVRPSYAQSGIGMGLVFAGPHAGGLSVRYKPIQVLVTGIGGKDGDFYVDVAARYNHAVRDWKRVKFKAFGQVDRRNRRGELGLTSMYLFTGGGTAELQIGRKPSSKGLYLTADIGFSIDHTGDVGSFPGLGMGIHFFF